MNIQPLTKPEFHCHLFVQQVLVSLITVVGVLNILPSAVRGATLQYKFTSIDFPGATDTAVSSINNIGQIVGTYDGTAIFRFDGNEFESFRPPGATEVFIPGTNDRAQIVGGFFDADFISRGFLYEEDQYTIINFPSNPPELIVGETGLSGINNNGMAVGYYFDAEFTTARAFSLDTTSATFTELRITNATDRAFAWGINNRNQIVGSYRNDSGFYGYVLTEGTTTQLEFPGSSLTAAYGINDQGMVVGSFFRPETGRDLYGFLWDAGKFTEVSVPGATQTFVSSINNVGQIGGYYFDVEGITRGYIATPIAEVPEPISALGLLVISMAAKYGPKGKGDRPST